MTGSLRGLVPDEQRRAWARYLLAVGGYAVSEGVAFGLAVPLLTGLLAHRPGSAAWWLIPLGAAAGFGWLAHYDFGLRALRLSSAWRRALYSRIGEQLLRLPLGWYDSPQAARLPQLITGDVARVANTVFLAQPLLTAAVTPATMAVFLLGYDWRTGLAALLAVPVVLAALTLGRRITERTEAAHHAATAEAGSRLTEFAGAQPTLRAAGQTAAGRRALDEALTAQYRAARGEVAGSLPGQYLGQLATQLAFTALLITGFALATGHYLAVPRAIALIVLGISLLRPLEAIVGAATALRACQASAHRVSELLAIAPLREPSAGRDSGHTSGRQIQDAGIELLDVHFA